MSAEATRSLIVGAFALTGRDELTARELIALARPCGVTPTNLKSHLSRMVAEGVLVRRVRSRDSGYRPSERRERVMEAVRERLRLTSQRWSGEWLLLMPRLPTDRPRRERWVRSLLFDGFRRRGRDAFVRPLWPTPWAVERATAHVRKSDGLLWRGRPFDDRQLEKVMRLYDLPRLHTRAMRFTERLTAEAARVSLPAHAWARLLALGGPVIRAISEPPVLMGAYSGCRDVVSAYLRFEESMRPQAEAFVRSVLEGGVRAATSPEPIPERLHA